MAEEPMPGFDVGHHAAEAFAWLWRGHRRPDFLRYVEASYAAPFPRLPRFRAVVLSQAEAGDVEHGWVQSIASRWWAADDAGFRAVGSEDLPPWWGDFNAAADAGRLDYLWPRVHFHVDGTRVAFVERLGPNHWCCKLGRVVLRDGASVVTDVRLVWNAVRGCAEGRPGPVRDGLEVTPEGPRPLCSPG